MVDSVAAAGTPGEVLEKIEQFVKAGARHLIFLPATRTGDFDSIVGHLFEDVMPRVRSRAMNPAWPRWLRPSRRGAASRTAP